MSDLRKIGALWKKQGKSGTFYSGTVNVEALQTALASGETRLLLFPVRNKRERGPDVELFSVLDQQSRQPAPSSQPATATEPLEADDIPF